MERMETVKTCRPGRMSVKPPVKRVKVGVETLTYRFDNKLDLWTGEPLTSAMERWDAGEDEKPGTWIHGVTPHVTDGCYVRKA